MTAEEKKSIASFIDLASNLVRGGYSPGEREYSFSDDLAAGHLTAAILVMVIDGAPDSGDSCGSFDSEAGRLLEKMLGSIGLSRENNCLITNISEYEGRVQSLKPRFILCLGEFSSRILLHNAEPIEKLRGRFIDCKIAGMTIPLIVTYHPGALLRNEDLKRPAWDDLKLLRAALGDLLPTQTGVK
jgi:DNA polymerase